MRARVLFFKAHTESWWGRGKARAEAYAERENEATGEVLPGGVRLVDQDQPDWVLLNLQCVAKHATLGYTTPQAEGEHDLTGERPLIWFLESFLETTRRAAETAASKLREDKSLSPPPRRDRGFAPARETQRERDTRWERSRRRRRRRRHTAPPPQRHLLLSERVLTRSSSLVAHCVRTPPRERERDAHARVPRVGCVAGRRALRWPRARS